MKDESLCTDDGTERYITYITVGYQVLLFFSIIVDSQSDGYPCL